MAEANVIVKCDKCNIVICELLAFVQNKADVMNEEDLMRLCSSTFSEEEIEEAKGLLFKSIPQAFLTKIKRKGSGKTRRNMQDIIALLKVTDPELVPIFVARELHRLPPVTWDHIDATRLL